MNAARRGEGSAAPPSRSRRASASSSVSCWATRATSVETSIAATSAAGMIGPNSRRIRPGRGNPRVRGQHSQAPTIATGRIGTPARFATSAKPLCTSPSRPSRVRVPSGKIVTAPPPRSLRMIVFIAATDEASRSIGTASRAEMIAPNGPQRKSELRARLDSRRSQTRPRSSGSRLLWWEERTSRPPSRGNGSANR